MLILIDHSAESVAPSYVKAGELVRGYDRYGQRLERAAGFQNPAAAPDLAF
jgi:hypothetical protein